MVYNYEPMREWLSNEEAASPLVTLESPILIMPIDAKERWDIMTANVPSTFIQTELPPGLENNDDAKIIRQEKERAQQTLVHLDET